MYILVYNFDKYIHISIDQHVTFIPTLAQMRIFLILVRKVIIARFTASMFSWTSAYIIILFVSLN